MHHALSGSHSLRSVFVRITAGDKILQLDSTDVHPFADASYGRDVVECRSAACAVHPCQNGAVCAENRVNGEWRCNCPAGFTGELCERPVCAANPCRRGGTCLGSKTGPGFLCLCPLGTQGALCELSKSTVESFFLHRCFTAGIAQCALG